MNPYGTRPPDRRSRGLGDALERLASLKIAAAAASVVTFGGLTAMIAADAASTPVAATSPAAASQPPDGTGGGTGSGSGGYGVTPYDPYGANTGGVPTTGSAGGGFQAQAPIVSAPS
ncbi:MAG TPA: hypothetical protein VG245_05360 [Candidatus Dormibacteraeota bacterium]|jgi:hypothetical protein|nr:hypothetical protein [Candidatus Dormibacteraeota bacterium]